MSFSVKLEQQPNYDILIFERTNSQYISDCISDLSYHIYDMKRETFFINANFLKSLLMVLRNIKWKDISKCSGIKSFVAESLRYLRLANINSFNPKIVITFIDNSVNFHWLCKRSFKTKYLAIQNGNRVLLKKDGTYGVFKNYIKVDGARAYELYKDYCIDYYFVWGQYDKDMFTKANASVEKYFITGSIVYGYYNYSKKTKKPFPATNELAIISTFRTKRIQNQNSLRVQKNYWKSIDLLHEFCSKYIKSYNLKTTVYMNYDSSNSIEAKEELKYLEQFYKGYADIKMRDQTKYSTYIGIENSEIIIGFRSAILREAFGMGKKTIMCDFTGSTLYTNFDDIVLFTKCAYKDFEQRLNNLKSEDTKSYINRSNRYRDYIHSNNKKSPHKMIRDAIDKILIE